MGYRDNNRSGGFGRDRPSSSFGRGRSSGGRSFGGRSSGGFGGRRERPEMHDVVCDKCGKDCQVPFKPTGDRPVLCSDCFGGSESGSSSRRSSSPRSFDSGSSSGSGMSKEQFNDINTKLDKILGILEMIEFEDESEESDEGDEADGEEEKEEKVA